MLITVPQFMHRNKQFPSSGVDCFCGFDIHKLFICHNSSLLEELDRSSTLVMSRGGLLGGKLASSASWNGTRDSGASRSPPAWPSYCDLYSPAMILLFPGSIRLSLDCPLQAYPGRGMIALGT